MQRYDLERRTIAPILEVEKAVELLNKAIAFRKG
jgi:hypothetical protein